ncbi:hypothetical protein Ari01nite_79080 [Paractinoplanes rishiriensis]|uniref:Uncharacterized protein n=1 Tax=Paractinoplanes rishiriensis TaxID=1050105 RepID=A0A919K8I0_9ACTN|nr:hypothetical protein Ari01nite_79080 [Actinoplanes rishiriensis]
MVGAVLSGTVVSGTVGSAETTGDGAAGEGDGEGDSEGDGEGDARTPGRDGGGPDVQPPAATASTTTIVARHDDRIPTLVLPAFVRICRGHIDSPAAAVRPFVTDVAKSSPPGDCGTRPG